MREYQAVKPVPVMIDGQEYFLLFTFGRIKRIREQLKVDLLQQQDVALDIFTKVLFQGLVDPRGLTEDSLDDKIAVTQLPYYIERLQLALNGQIPPSDATKNALSASSTEAGSANPKTRKKGNSHSGAQQLDSGDSPTVSSGN